MPVMTFKGHCRTLAQAGDRVPEGLDQEGEPDLLSCGLFSSWSFFADWWVGVRPPGQRTLPDTTRKPRDTMVRRQNFLILIGTSPGQVQEMSDDPCSTCGHGGLHSELTRRRPCLTDAPTLKRHSRTLGHRGILFNPTESQILTGKCRAGGGTMRQPRRHRAPRPGQRDEV